MVTSDHVLSRRLPTRGNMRIGPVGHGLSFNGKTSYGLVNHSDLLDPGDSIVRVSIRLQTTDRNVNEEDWDLVKYGYSASSPGLLTLEYYDDGTVSFGAKGDEHKAHVSRQSEPGRREVAPGHRREG